MLHQFVPVGSITPEPVPGFASQPFSHLEIRWHLLVVEEWPFIFVQKQKTGQQANYTFFIHPQLNGIRESSNSSCWKRP